MKIDNFKIDLTNMTLLPLAGLQVIILISLYPIISSLMGKLRKFIGGF